MRRARSSAEGSRDAPARKFAAFSSTERTKSRTTPATSSAEIGWKHAPFEIPEAIYREWDARANATPPSGSRVNVEYPIDEGNPLAHRKYTHPGSPRLSITHDEPVAIVLDLQ